MKGQKEDVYSIQTGIYRYKKNAYRNYSYLSDKGYKPVIVMLDFMQKFKIYAVRTGKYKERETAEAAFIDFKQKERGDAYLTTLYDKDYLITLCKKFLKQTP